MLGKRTEQRDLFDVGNVFPLELDPRSFHGQLARAAERLFRDEDFAACYAQRTGRPSLPPAQLALLTLLQHEAGVSDAEAVARSAYDLRWAAVLRRPAGTPLCAKSTLQLFRSHLILHDAVWQVFQRSLQEAQSAGLLSGAALRIALDTKPILGRALAAAHREAAAARAERQRLQRYFAGSVKGSVDLDWSDPAARQAFLGELVADARRLLAAADQSAVRDAATLLERLLLQDVVETTGSDGTRRAELKEGTTPGRSPSVTDPEQRHGHKSHCRTFTGHKASVAVDRASGLLVGATVLPGDAPDATDLLAQVEQVERNTGQPVAETVGDGAYGSGATRQEFAAAGRVLHAKTPREAGKDGCFPKSRFEIDLETPSVTCPGGVRSRNYTAAAGGGMLFSFGEACATCPLRPHCTRAKGGRQIRVHPQEALLRAARAFAATPAGKQTLRERVVVEHGLARLGQLGIGQARYLGRKKTRLQLLLAATVANLRRTWNWQARRGRGGEAGIRFARGWGRGGHRWRTILGGWNPFAGVSFPARSWAFRPRF